MLNYPALHYFCYHHLHTNRDINPHIPQYISQAPWYVSLGRPSLKHQRPQEEKYKDLSSIDDWYKKGVVKDKVATKYRKGACENCGSMTHKKKDCLEVRSVEYTYYGKGAVICEIFIPQTFWSCDNCYTEDMVKFATLAKTCISVNYTKVARIGKIFRPVKFLAMQYLAGFPRMKMLPQTLSCTIDTMHDGVTFNQ